MDWSTLYGACLVLGVTVVGASFLFGHLGFGDHAGGGHDVGGGHDLAAGHDVSADTHADDAHSHAATPHLPLLSPSVLSIFVGMFGAGGLFLHRVLHVEALLAHVLGAAGISIGSGLGMAFLMQQLMKNAEKNSVASFRDAVGREVEVLTAIRGTDLGEIAYTAGGSRQTLLARSASGADFPQGARVHVLDIREGIAYVGERGSRPLVGVPVAPVEGAKTKLQG